MEVTIYKLQHPVFGRRDRGGQKVYPIQGTEFGREGADEKHLAADVIGGRYADEVLLGWGESDEGVKEIVPYEPEETLYQRVAEVVSKHFEGREEDLTVVLYT